MALGRSYLLVDEHNFKNLFFKIYLAAPHEPLMVTSSFLKAWITAKSVSILSSTSVYATYV